MGRPVAMWSGLRLAAYACCALAAVSLAGCQAKPQPRPHNTAAPSPQPKTPDRHARKAPQPAAEEPAYCSGDGWELLEAGVLLSQFADVPEWMAPALRRRVGNSFYDWSAERADINGDGRADYILTGGGRSGWCGNGGCQTLVVVSTSDGRRFFDLGTAFSVAVDFDKREQQPVLAVPMGGWHCNGNLASVDDCSMYLTWDQRREGFRAARTRRHPAADAYNASAYADGVTAWSPLRPYRVRSVSGTVQCEGAVCDVVVPAPTPCDYETVSLTKAWFPRTGSVATRVLAACPQGRECVITGTANGSGELISLKRVRRADAPRSP